MFTQIIVFLKRFVIIVAVAAVVFFAGYITNKILDGKKDEQIAQQVVPTPTPAPIAQPIAAEPAKIETTSTTPETTTPAPQETPTASEPVQQAAPVVVEPPRPTIGFTPGEAKVGNLYVKAQSAAVKIVKPADTYGKTTVAGTLTFLVQNTGNEPISITGTDRSLSIQYNDGTELKYAYENKVNGLSFCDDAPEQCINRKPSPFTQLEPSSSPVSVSIYFENTMNAPAVKSMPLIKTGTFTTRLLVLDGTTPKNVNISLTDFPVTNNMPKE